MIELADVEAAAERLAGVAHRTPVVTSRTLDERVGASVHVKAECFQRGGAFKFRGAYNKISSLDDRRAHARRPRVLVGTRAAARLDGVAHRTPVVRSRTLDERVGSRVHIKAENFQRVGAFKFRGAYNKISSLDAEALARGVVAYSSGNHAQAVALAAKLLGSHATIVMPADAPPRSSRRRAATGPRSCSTTAGRRAARRSAPRSPTSADSTLVQPYDDPLVMAGQGTAALELLEDVPDLDVLLAPVSGGGLIAGCATAAKALRPQCRVVGVEPETGNDTQQSLASGERVRIDGAARRSPTACRRRSRAS